MEIIAGLFIVISICIFIISDIMILIRAFKTSLLWGFGSLFIPVVEISFIIIYWSETKKYVFWLLIALLTFIVGGTLHNLS